MAVQCAQRSCESAGQLMMTKPLDPPSVRDLAVQGRSFGLGRKIDQSLPLPHHLTTLTPLRFLYTQDPNNISCTRNN